MRLFSLERINAPLSLLTKVNSATHAAVQAAFTVGVAEGIFGLVPGAVGGDHPIDAERL